VARARAAVDRLQPFHWDVQGLTDQYKCVFDRDAYWLPFLDLPGVIELAEAALGSDCHVIGQTARRSHPGHQDVGVHADYLALEVPEDLLADPRFTLPMFICTAHLDLSDITPELCPRYVIPGSHRSGRWPRPYDLTWPGRRPQPILCRAGDVLFFRSDLWHSGSNNNTPDQARYLLQIHYGRRMPVRRAWTDRIARPTQRYHHCRGHPLDANLDAEENTPCGRTRQTRSPRSCTFSAPIATAPSSWSS
jgi:hypothetical protein